MQEDILAELQTKMGTVLGGTGVFGKTGSMGLDPYTILGLKSDATEEEVRTRFRELAKLLHPDTAPIKGTSFLFQLVNIANEMIAQDRRSRQS